MKIHCQLVTKDNGASSYSMKEETRVEGPLEFGSLNKAGGDRKSAKYLEKNHQIIKNNLKDLVE